MKQRSSGFYLGIVASLILGFGIIALVVLGLRADEGIGYDPAVLQATKTGPNTATLNLSTYPDSMVCHPNAPNPEIGWVTYCPSTSWELPANSIITVVINQYDSASGLYNDFFQKVQGTVGGIAMYNSKPMSQINGDAAAHTFTIQSQPDEINPIFVNVPLLGSRTTPPTWRMGIRSPTSLSSSSVQAPQDTLTSGTATSLVATTANLPMASAGRCPPAGIWLERLPSPIIKEGKMSEPNIEGNTGGASPAPALTEPHHLRRALILWAVLSVIGIAVWLAVSPFILPQAAGSLDAADNFTFSMLTVLSIPVALFVFAFLIYSLLFFRSRGRPTEDGVPLLPRPSLQIGWLGITSALCLFLLIWGLFAFYQETSAASTSTLTVNVTAQQWQWTFDFPQYGATSQGAQMIELPVNRPVEFYVTSKDVLHGFSILALGARVDANPGYVTTTAVITPTQIGSYAVRCIEMCGLFHSDMWEAVNVVSADAFNSWIVSQGGHP